MAGRTQPRACGGVLIRLGRRGTLGGGRWFSSAGHHLDLSTPLRLEYRAHIIGALIARALTEHGSGSAADIHTWIQGDARGVPVRTVLETCASLARWGVLDRLRSNPRGRSTYSIRVHSGDPPPIPEDTLRSGVACALGATIFVVIRDLSQEWAVPRPFHGMRLVDVHEHVQVRLQRTRHPSGIWRVCRALQAQRILRSAALRSDKYTPHRLLGVDQHGQQHG